MQSFLKACLGESKIFTASAEYIDKEGVLNLDNIPEECEEMSIGNTCSLSIKKITVTESSKLKKLSLFGCMNLKELPDGLNNLRHLEELNLINCANLEITDSLMDKISDLEKRGCNVIYSEQLTKRFEDLLDSIKCRIENCTNQPRMYDTKRLFNKFLQDYVAERGGLRDILNTLEPLVTMIEKHPEHRFWVEELAGLYLEGCVNQPVFGVAIISALAAIVAKYDIKADIIEQLEVAKQLMAKRLIAQFAREKKIPAKGLEVEFGNELMRVAFKELGDIAAQWTAPKKVAHANGVLGFVRENKDEAVQLVQNRVLKVSPEKVAEWLLLEYPEIWGKIAFPEKSEEVDRQFASNNKALEILVDADSYEHIKEALQELSLDKKDAVKKDMKAYIGKLREQISNYPISELFLYTKQLVVQGLVQQLCTENAQKNDDFYGYSNSIAGVPEKLKKFYEELNDEKLNVLSKEVRELTMAEIKKRQSILDGLKQHDSFRNILEDDPRDDSHVAMLERQRSGGLFTLAL